MKNEAGWRWIGCVLAVGVLLAPGRSWAISVDCSNGGDTFGQTVAAGGDFDGDGKGDYAVGSPCARASRRFRAGRVRVFSGADGSRLLSLSGTIDSDNLGSALAFIGDVDGDGGDELAVGLQGFDAPASGGGTTNATGRVEVYSFLEGRLYAVNGLTPSENLGETIARLGRDLDQDQVEDFVVGGGGARIEGTPVGVARVLSGADGSVIFEDFGRRSQDRWGSVLAEGLDHNGDGEVDLLFASSVAKFGSADSGGGAGPLATSTTTSTTTTVSQTTTTTVQSFAGELRVFSGLDPGTRLLQVQGRLDERLARGLAAISDLDGDQRDDLLVGLSGRDVGNSNSAGVVRIFGGDGSALETLTEPVVAVGAAFGTAIASPGNLDDRGNDDLVASAPAANVGGLTQVGRLHAFDGDGRDLIWTRNGTTARMRFGQALAVGDDYNDDGINDLLVGAPGDVFRGRRGAGSASIVSGRDGAILETFHGRRGLETRLFVAGAERGGKATIRSFQPSGGRRELGIGALRGFNAEAPSVAVFDDFSDQEPGQVLLVLGGGPGSGTPLVEIARAGRRRTVLSRFLAGEGAYSGGVNVGAGNLEGSDGEADRDEIVAVEADADAGGVDLAIFQKRDTDPLGRITWKRVRGFRVFADGDRVEGLNINARGANIAVGNLTTATGDEIVVGPATGLPVVRVFSRTGSQQREWLAYPPEGSAGRANDGVRVAIGDLDGNGTNEIVTTPASGQLWVRAWTQAGERFPSDAGQVSFFVNTFDLRDVEGLRVVLADVDFDDRTEILITPGPGGQGRIEAYETDGTPVVGWKPFRPFGSGYRGGLILAATDRFLRP
jgi:hypothetical protein